MPHPWPFSPLILPQPSFYPSSTFAPTPWSLENAIAGPSFSSVPLVCPAHLPHVRASLQFASFSSRETVVSLVLPALLASLAPL